MQNKAQVKIASMLDGLRNALAGKADDFTGMLGGKLDDISRELGMTGPTAATGATIGGLLAGGLAGGGAASGLVLSEILRQRAAEQERIAREDDMQKLMRVLSQYKGENY